MSELHPADALDEILPRLDAVVLCVPLNPRTRDMIAARQLGLLRQGAVLVNVGRGQLVVEEDLVDALESGHLGGAGLDVTYEEPLDAESRLWTAPNLILTPHVGGQSATRIDDMTNFFCRNLECYLRGMPLRNVVDKELGFPFPEGGAGVM